MIEKPTNMLFDERSSMDELFDLVMTTDDVFVEPSVPEEIEADIIEPEPTEDEEYDTSTFLVEEKLETVVSTPVKAKHRRRTLINRRVPSPEPVETKIETDTKPQPGRRKIEKPNIETNECCVCRSTEKLGYTCFQKQLTYFLQIGALKKTPKNTAMCKSCYNKWHHAVRRSSWGETTKATTTTPKRTRIKPKLEPKTVPTPTSKVTTGRKRKRIVKSEHMESEEESEEEVIERQLSREEAMKVRPKLKRGISPEALIQYYWGDELREECTKRGINTSGGTKKQYIAR